MKLIDILVRELKEWPESAGLTVTQDPDKELRFDHARYDFYASELAEDAGDSFGEGEKVYRDQWQAAVDALKQAEGLAAWAGDSVPPIGIACEVTNHITGGWDVVDEVLAHTILKSKLVAVFRRAESIHYSPADTFRPIRSPQQIQADARQAGIEALTNDINGRLDFNFNIDEIQGLYDGGYRAPESAQ